MHVPAFQWPKAWILDLPLSYVCSKWARMEYNTAMSYGSRFNMNCTNFTEDDWTSLNLVRSIAATLGAVIILAILLFLICYKAYSSLFQRLYLYLIIVTLLNEMTGIVSIDHQCCLLYTSPSPRDATLSRMPSSA